MIWYVRDWHQSIYAPSPCLHGMLSSCVRGLGGGGGGGGTGPTRPAGRAAIGWRRRRVTIYMEIGSQAPEPGWLRCEHLHFNQRGQGPPTSWARECTCNTRRAPLVTGDEAHLAVHPPSNSRKAVVSVAVFPLAGEVAAQLW